MNVQFSPPTLNELTQAYNSFQLNKVTLDLFLQTYQWCRYDPRLGELLVYALKEHWANWNPLDISNKIKFHPWPQVLGVLGEHVRLLLPKTERHFFASWINCCFYHVSWEPDGSLFHIGLFKFGGKLLQREAFDAISLYLKWGFYAKTPMINFRSQPNLSRRTLIKKSDRLIKLKELFTFKKKIRVKDYIEFLDSKISKRTAELDLSHWATKIGDTKGSVYKQRLK